MSRLEKMIRIYAFIHNVDMDTAAYRVIVDLIKSTDGVRSCAGLYDRMFGDEDDADKT